MTATERRLLLWGFVICTNAVVAGTGIVYLVVHS